MAGMPSPRVLVEVLRSGNLARGCVPPGRA
jgi:hypothetical protein